MQTRPTCAYIRSEVSATRMQVLVDYRSPGVGAFDEVRHVGEGQDHAAVRLLHLGVKGLGLDFVGLYLDFSSSEPYIQMFKCRTSRILQARACCLGFSRIVGLRPVSISAI